MCNQFPTGTNVQVIQGTYGLGFVAENEEPLSEEAVRACQEINARATAASSSEAMPSAQPGTLVSAQGTPAAPGDDGGQDWWRARGGWYFPPPATAAIAPTAAAPRTGLPDVESAKLRTRDPPPGETIRVEAPEEEPVVTREVTAGETATAKKA